MQQDDLVIVTPTFKHGDFHTPILYLIDMMKTQALLVPEFQREPCWPFDKKRAWIDSMINQQAIGVIVTYQIKGEGAIFLDDGLQRLTAAKEFINTPTEFKYKFGIGQAKSICMSFSIPVQHRHYESHREAMKAFQNLNNGTSLTAAEFHKGELIINSDVGRKIYSDAPQIVDSVLLSHVTSKSSNRDTQSRLFRDSLGLFYQYMTKDERITFYRVGHRQDNDLSIENRIREYIDANDYTSGTIDKKLREFKNFLASEMAFIHSVVIETEQIGKAFSQASIRNLLHTAIWRKNSNISRIHYDEFIRQIINAWKEYSNFTAKIEIRNPDKDVVTVSLATDNLYSTSVFCDEVGNPLFNKQRRKNRKTAPGYDNSHIKPFSIFGDGDTIIEPSGINRARGAKEITA